MQILRHLLSFDPNHPQQRRQLLELYTQMGFTTEAKDTAGLILQQFPADPEALRCLAQCHLRLRDEADALTVARQWGDVQPENIDARGLVLWLTYETDKNANGSVKLAEQWSTQHPNDPVYETLRGYAYMLANRPDDAKVCLKAAAAASPGIRAVILAGGKLDRLAIAPGFARIAQNWPPLTQPKTRSFARCLSDGFGRRAATPM